MQKGDVEFIRDRLLPWVNVKSVIIAYSSSTKKWPDIWVQLGEVPVITVTKEWARQGVHERRKRLVHEFLHIKGMDHDDSIGYSTIPAKDSYSMKVYKGLVANPTGRKRRLEAKWSNEWQGLDSDEKHRLTLNIPGNHDVFGVIDYTGVILGGGYVTLPSGDNCYVVIQWHREGDQDKWDNWYWCDDISSAEARRMAQHHRRDLRFDAKWEREERLGTR